MLKRMIALVLMVGLAVPALAGDVEDVNLPAGLEVDGQALVLNGPAVRTKLWIDVYVAGLYLPEKTSDAAQAMSMDGPAQMTMAFIYDVDADSICDGWKDGIEDNLETELKGLEDRLEDLCKATPDVVDGETLTFAWTPSREQTVFMVDGVFLDAIPGRDFFDALLSCWVGPDPGPGDDFKEALLGLE